MRSHLPTLDSSPCEPLPHDLGRTVKGASLRSNKESLGIHLTKEEDNDGRSCLFLSHARMAEYKYSDPTHFEIQSTRLRGPHVLSTAEPSVTEHGGARVEMPCSLLIQLKSCQLRLANLTRAGLAATI